MTCRFHREADEFLMHGDSGLAAQHASDPWVDGCVRVICMFSRKTLEPSSRTIPLS